MPRHQQALLNDKGFNVLVLLDACKPEYLEKLWPGTEAVHALGGITHVWCEHFWQRVCTRPHVYLTANPVVDWKAKKLKVKHAHIVPVWQHCWAKHTEYELGAVHPKAMTDYVLAWVEEHGQPEQMVVHYLQPHAPYIGEPVLPFRTGNLHDGPTPHNDIGVHQAVKEGKLSWHDVRAAYWGNLALVVPEAKRLVAALKGRIAVTSDHGEALGEAEGAGKPVQYGHAGVPYGLIRYVPWRVEDGGSYEASAIPTEEGAADSVAMTERLHSLGYT